MLFLRFFSSVKLEIFFKQFCSMTIRMDVGSVKF